MALLARHRALLAMHMTSRMYGCGVVVCLCVVCVVFVYVLRMHGCGVVARRRVCVRCVSVCGMRLCIANVWMRRGCVSVRLCVVCVAVYCSVLQCCTRESLYNCHAQLPLASQPATYIWSCVAVCVLQDSLSHSISSKCRGTVVCVAKRALYIAKRALHIA